MARPTKQRGGGGKLTRSETVTVRLDPRLRYLAELGALKQRRTLSSFIEWAIENGLSQVSLSAPGPNEAITVADEAVRLWDVDAPDRFVKLALHYPDLLTHEEQKRWKLVRETGSLWLGGVIGKNPDPEKLVNMAALRQAWAEVCAVARGDEDPSIFDSIF